jgi:hypothetical protein
MPLVWTLNLYHHNQGEVVSRIEAGLPNPLAWELVNHTS